MQITMSGSYDFLKRVASANGANVCTEVQLTGTQILFCHSLMSLEFYKLFN